jgi:DNA-binding NtrC family response regulator
MSRTLPLIRRVLILDPQPECFAGLERALEQSIGPDAVVHRVGSVRELRADLATGFPYQLVVAAFPGVDLEPNAQPPIATLRKDAPDLPILAVSSRGDVELAQRAIDAGAADLLVLGDKLRERVDTALAKLSGLVRVIHDKRALHEESRRLIDAERERYRILGESSQIRALIDQVRRVASVPRPVLIVGERGTGKELVARAIHEAAGSAERPFLAVNCAAFPDTLLESELFGHERGAFTGADHVARGRFEQADGGTLFLDEIGFMSLPFQQKILRTVEYGSFRRVGGTEEIRTDARIIAATNADLDERMQRGEFLRDLYDRLSFEIIHVPALRERAGDIELLAQEFLERFMREIPAFRGKRLSRRALDALGRYPFPGNVRELKNIIERAAYKDTTNEITPEDLGLSMAHPRPLNGSFADQVEALKRSLILTALEEASGNQAEAARILGMSYHQFRHYYRSLGRDEG